MIFTLIERRRIRRARRVHFALPVYITKGMIMSKTLTLPNDAQATIKVLATDGIGAPISLPSGGVATTSDATLFSASIDANGDVVAVAVAGAVGTGTLIYTNGSLTDSATVNVAAPAAAAVSLDVADAVLAAAPTPAAATPAVVPLSNASMTAPASA
jgi:hypothetical protein